MLAKRILPCLDIKDGRTVKGVNFVELRDAGDPVELGSIYAEQGADERRQRRMMQAGDLPSTQQPAL